MDKFERIYKIHSMLTSARLPISRQSFEEELVCTRSSVKRLIETMRDILHAPIVYDRERNGYYYDSKHTDRYELPGLWFNTSELYSLLLAQHLLKTVEPGLFEERLQPLRSRIEKILGQQQVQQSEVDRRVRILPIASRRFDSRHYVTLAGALLQRKQLQVTYAGRSRDEKTERVLSPQRLVLYRDNWYLDAWCHLREGLRTFSLDRIQHSKVVDTKAKDLSEKELDDHFATSYGIFSGLPTHTAILKFNAHATKWVAAEHWHPQQSGQLDIDGCYTLRIPYKHPQELIRDILKYGPDVEVIAPAALRKDILGLHKKAAKQYES